MNSLLLVILSLAGYIIAYRLYGRFLAKKLFNLTNNNKMPSHTERDGVDYVPTKKNIVFGHHFTTIAGLGPIVGPAIGIFWGWLPAFIWVFVGSIFMGAVHDFSVLVISARNRGKTIGDLTEKIISRSTRNAFQVLIQFLLLIVLSVFAIIVASLFVKYPESVIPVWMQIPIAVWLGYMIRKGYNDLLFSIIAVALLYVMILIGASYPVSIKNILNSEFLNIGNDLYKIIETKFPFLLNFITNPEQLIWSILLFIYVYFASTIPVHKLLQPRDYINSHQLTIAMILLIIGLAVAHPVIAAPEINQNAFHSDESIPGIMPFLFIFIACGAISGFHSLASSGTTVKQVNQEKDTLFIGYGGMLLESLLAVLVLMAIAGGLQLGFQTDPEFTGNSVKYAAYYDHYASWKGINVNLGTKLEAFVIGASNLFENIGINRKFASTLIAVFIVSFANTTLDSATRIQRLSFQELTSSKRKGKSRFSNRYIATFIIILPALFLSVHTESALALWRLFGAMNQLLAALGLIVVSVYLYHKKKNYLFAFIPMIFILIITVWAMIHNLIDFLFNDENKNYILAALAFIILIITVWMLIGGINTVFRKINRDPDYN